MMFRIQNVIGRLRGFARDERGTATTELVIILPMLVWSMLAISTFFEAYRASSINLKAAYTISDLISRENPFIGPDYIDGLNDVYDYLSASQSPTWLRVSLVQFDTEDPDNENDGKHTLKWSWGTHGKTKLFQGTLSTIAHHIPVMGDGDSLILVETHMKYKPFGNIGIDAYDLENFIATRPRFTPPKFSYSH